MLDVRKILLLREVDARGSIAAAAQALNYTRSAVSQHLSALEAETGVPLLDRSNGKATLTAVGKLLVEHGELILSQMEAAESQLQEYSGRVYGDLRIGVPFHEGPAMLVPTLVAMRREYPMLRITLHDTRGTEARQAVRLNQLDLVITTRYRQIPEPKVPGLSEEPLAHDRLRLAVPPDHELAGAGPRPLADFADAPWIFDEDSALGRLTLHACHGAGFTPDPVAATDDMQAVLGLVSHGWGVALVPDLVPDRAGCPVDRIELADTVLTREVSLVVRTGTVDCPSIAALLAMVRRNTESKREHRGRSATPGPNGGPPLPLQRPIADLCAMLRGHLLVDCGERHLVLQVRRQNSISLHRSLLVGLAQRRRPRPANRTSTRIRYR